MLGGDADVNEVQLVRTAHRDCTDTDSYRLGIFECIETDRAFGCEHSACDFVINCGPDLTFGDTGVMSNIQIGQVSTKQIRNNSTDRAWMVSVHVCSHYIISCVLSEGARRLHDINVSTLLDQAACNCVEAHRNGCCGILVVSDPTIHPVTHVLLTNRGAREGNHSGAIDHKE